MWFVYFVVILILMLGAASVRPCYAYFQIKKYGKIYEAKIKHINVWQRPMCLVSFYHEGVEMAIEFRGYKIFHEYTVGDAVTVMYYPEYPYAVLLK
jgi:hypothetical protein